MKKLGISDYREFHRWTVDNRAEFWQQAAEHLQIAWKNPADQVLDSSAGVENAVWFPGSKLNIVESCFLANENDTAIVTGQSGAPLRRLTYRELRKQTNQVANSLVLAGFKPGLSLIHI